MHTISSFPENLAPLIMCISRSLPPSTLMSRFSTYPLVSRAARVTTPAISGDTSHFYHVVTAASSNQNGQRRHAHDSPSEIRAPSQVEAVNFGQDRFQSQQEQSQQYCAASWHLRRRYYASQSKSCSWQAPLLPRPVPGPRRSGRQLVDNLRPRSCRAFFATVSDHPIAPPCSDLNNATDRNRRELDQRIMQAARKLYQYRLQHSASNEVASTISSLRDQYAERMECVMPFKLANESRPHENRRAVVDAPGTGRRDEVSGSGVMNDKDEREIYGDATARKDAEGDDGVLLIAYVRDAEAEPAKAKIEVCTGFAIEGGDKLTKVEDGPLSRQSTLVVSCAHPLEACASHVSATVSKNQDPSVAFAMTRTGLIYPIIALVSSIPRSDLILLQLGSQPLSTDPDSSATSDTPHTPIRSLPVSAYPAVLDSTLYVSSFHAWEALPANTTANDPPTLQTSHNLPTSPTPTTPHQRWGLATLTTYHDTCGMEATPGTYDDLAQLDFKLLPSHPYNSPALLRQPAFPPPGSSGGPIIDESSGAVVGVVRGHEMGVLGGKRGWAVPAERIFFFFSLF